MRVFLSLFLAWPALAAEVLHITPSGRLLAVSQEHGHTFSRRQAACVIDENKAELLCGWIVEAVGSGAVLLLPKSDSSVAVGNLVEHATKKSEHAQEEAENALHETETLHWDEMIAMYRAFNGGPEELVREMEEVAKRKATHLPQLVALGANMTSPMVNLQGALDETWAVGMLVSLVSISNPSVTAKVFGGYFTVNYYPNEVFRGFWLQGGPGFFHGDFETGSSSLTGFVFSAIATAGYRFSFGNFGLGIAGGGQMFQLPSATGNFFEMGPAATLELAYRF